MCYEVEEEITGHAVHGQSMWLGTLVQEHVCECLCTIIIATRMGHRGQKEIDENTCSSHCCAEATVMFAVS